MSKHETMDLNTLIDMAMAQVQRLDNLWSAAMAQICERQDDSEKKAA
jgi:hypothetical protein